MVKYQHQATDTQLLHLSTNYSTTITRRLFPYNSEIIGAPNWPSAGTKHITLLLFKYYISNFSVNTDRIADYLEVSKDTILFTGAKIL
jgi:hypothetical protein